MPVLSRFEPVWPAAVAIFCFSSISRDISLASSWLGDGLGEPRDPAELLKVFLVRTLFSVPARAEDGNLFQDPARLARQFAWCACPGRIPGSRALPGPARGQCSPAFLQALTPRVFAYFPERRAQTVGRWGECHGHRRDSVPRVRPSGRDCGSACRRSKNAPLISPAVPADTKSCPVPGMCQGGLRFL